MAKQTEEEILCIECGIALSEDDKQAGKDSNVPSDEWLCLKCLYSYYKESSFDE